MKENSQDVALRPRDWLLLFFSSFFISLKARSCDKAVGLCHYSFVVADTLRPVSERKGALVKCKFNL